MKHPLDWLNILLILLSLGLAIYLPFTLFLVAYAALGPLHYLTEIHWIRKKGYFVDSKRWPWISVAFAALVALPPLFYHVFLKQLPETFWPKQLLADFSVWTNGFIFLALVIAAALVLIKATRLRWIIIGLGGLVALLINAVPMYIMVVGLLIPTIIHVYAFTILFMLYGALKNRSKPGYASVALLVMAAGVIALLPIEADNYLFSDTVKNAISDNGFHVLNTRIRQILGLSDGKTFYFYEQAELKVQIFISFAYIYHYLNWFSKTAVIGWHKQLTHRNTMVISLLWLVCLVLFWWDYRVGFYVALTFSFLHVMLEFPINIISLREVTTILVRRLKLGKA